MFTNEQADYLIKLPKKILENDALINDLRIEQKFPFTIRYILGSPSDYEFTFLLEVYQSKKAALKVSLYYQEDQSKVGLLRVDFNGTHKNPESIIDGLPIKFHKYAGKWFDNNEHHIHFYFQDYKPLAWALPLVDDEFPVKEIKNNQNVGDAFLAFCSRINLVTKVEVDSVLI